MRRLTVYALLLLTTLAIVALGWNVYYRAVESPAARSDFLMFRAAGRAILDGEDVYAVRHQRGWPFYYPQTMAVLMVPLALLPVGPAVVAWYAVSVAALFWAGLRLVRLCDELAGRPVGPWVVAAFLVNFGPIVSGLQRGQLSALLFMLMVEAFWWYHRGRMAHSGMFVALAAALKVYPALLILPLVVRREWRGLAAFLGGLAALWIVVPMMARGPQVGWEATRQWTSAILLPFLTDGSYADREVFAHFNQFSPSNQSLFGFFARWLTGDALPAGDSFPLSLAWISVAAARGLGLAASGVVVVAIAVLALRRSERGGVREALLWCLPMLAANFVSHIAWHHYYTVLAMPYALAAVRITTGLPHWRRTWLAWALGLALLGNWLHFGVHLCRHMGVFLLGSMALWIAIAADVSVRRAKDQDRPRVCPSAGKLARGAHAGRRGGRSVGPPSIAGDSGDE